MSGLFGFDGFQERELLKLFELEEAEFERDLELAARDRALERADMVFDGGVRHAGLLRAALVGVSQVAVPDVRGAGAGAARPALDPREERTLGWMPQR